MPLPRWGNAARTPQEKSPSPLAFELLRLVLRTQPRSFETPDLLASNPALKRWAILACLFGTIRQRASDSDKTAPVISSTNCG
jgi:hypothetical protein